MDPVLHHIALTVRDADVSKAWYTRLFGREPAIDQDTGVYREVVYIFPNRLVLALHAFPDGSQDRFDERRSGLDHLAFTASRVELDEWVARLDEMGIEHGRIIDTPDGSALAFRDPDNVQLELWADPS